MIKKLQTTTAGLNVSVYKINEIIDHLNTAHPCEMKDDEKVLGRLMNEIYYYITGEGLVIKTGWNASLADKKREEFGNYFSTEKAAETARDVMEKILKQY